MQLTVAAGAGVSPSTRGRRGHSHGETKGHKTLGQRDIPETRSRLLSQFDRHLRLHWRGLLLGTRLSGAASSRPLTEGYTYLSLPPLSPVRDQELEWAGRRLGVQVLDVGLAAI